jgi:hypothetical protein
MRRYVVFRNIITSCDKLIHILNIFDIVHISFYIYLIEKKPAISYF